MNKDKILVLDSGGSLFKTLEYPSFKKNFYNDISEIKLDGFSKIILTGGRSHLFKFKKKVDSVDLSKNEIYNIGTGSSFLSGESDCLVVSIGTGTPIIKVSNNKVEHIGGTGLGAGTIYGMSQYVCQSATIDKINFLAKNGILNNVNLTVGDIYQFQNQISIPLDATAGNFAKLNHESRMSDIILGLMNMVGESIGSLSCALNKSNYKIVIVGGGLFYPKFIESLQQTIHFYGHDSIALKDGIFAGCYGALNNVINL